MKLLTKRKKDRINKYIKLGEKNLEKLGIKSSKLSKLINKKYKIYKIMNKYIKF